MAELQRAFISPDMISVGDTLIEAVVTAERIPSDGLVIYIRPLEAPAALASLIVVIDERDLAEVQKLLGEERSVLPMAWEDDLAVAIEALEEIAQAKEGTTLFDQYMTAADIAGKCVDLAKAALTKIADTEASNGTSRDS